MLMGVGIRCYQLTEPGITDFHAWRQADTAAFTHGYLDETLNPFHPTVDRYPCELQGEPFGLVEAELPVVGWLAALPLAALGVDFPPAWYLRAISLLFFALTCLYLYLMVLRLGGEESEALLAVAALCLLPLSIYFTRTIQPDGPSLFFGIAFLYHLLVWLEDDRLADAVLSGVFATLVLLLKLSNGFLVFPALYLFISRKGLVGALRTPQYWLWGVAILVPVAAWSLYAHDFPWTFGIWGNRSGSKFTDWQIFSDPATWRKLSERLVFDILTWSGLMLAVVGATRARGREVVRFAAVWAIAFILFVCATLRGNETHIYYQLPIVVPASILIGVGARILWRAGHAGRAATAVALVVYAVTSYHILLGPTRGWENGYFNDDVPADIQEASRLVRKNLAPGEKFVSTSRHPALFFNARHRGWFYDGEAVPGFIACTDEEAPYVLWTKDDRRRATKMMRRDKTLQSQLVEVERGKHYSLWKVEQDSDVIYLRAVGGKGGSAFVWECPEGQAIAGLNIHRARDGEVVGALQASCAPVGDQQRQQQPRQQGTVGPWKGKHRSADGPDELRCPEGELAVGLEGHAEGLIEHLEPTCSPTANRPSKSTGETSFRLRCPPGSVLTGIHGQAGLYVDGVGGICAPPEAPSE
ncbi:ArnT family glycosyltransferase [Persicimonas caeni]|uniref:ArnT family glycosyltransferase n=1 Tax=Persicimonas caeni TaxID=2292766 RepID=UPI001FE7739C|nr:glycosyltransferase family 39 protein [Persicimonas caeni]